MSNLRRILPLLLCLSLLCACVQTVSYTHLTLPTK